MTWLKAIFLILFFIITLSLIGFYFAIRPIRITSNITPADLKVPYEEISFTTQDHVLIHGWFIPNKNPRAKTIILLHGYPADKGDILISRIFLHKKFNLLFIDFRYFGKSSGAYTTVGKEEVQDIKAAIHYLQQRGIQSVGIWGLSLGASVAIMAAAEMPEIKVIVAESAYANLYEMAQSYYRIPGLNYILAELTRWWGLVFLHQDIKTVSPEKAAAKLTIPILILHSRNDSVVSFQHAKKLEKALSHNPHVQSHFADKLRHGELLQQDQAIIEDFFEKHL